MLVGAMDKANVPMKGMVAKIDGTQSRGPASMYGCLRRKRHAHAIGNKPHDSLQLVCFAYFPWFDVHVSKKSIHLPAAKRRAIVADEWLVGQQPGPVAAAHFAWNYKPEWFVCQGRPAQVTLQRERGAYHGGHVEFASIHEVDQRDGQTWHDASTAAGALLVKLCQRIRQKRALQRRNGANIDQLA